MPFVLNKKIESVFEVVSSPFGSQLKDFTNSSNFIDFIVFFLKLMYTSSFFNSHSRFSTLSPVYEYAFTIRARNSFIVNATGVSILKLLLSCFVFGNLQRMFRSFVPTIVENKNIFFSNVVFFSILTKYSVFILITNESQSKWCKWLFLLVSDKESL